MRMLQKCYMINKDKKDIMKSITKHYKKIRITYIGVSVLAIIVSAFFLPNFTKIVSSGNNMFTVSVNGIQVGTVGDLDSIDEYVRLARLEIAKESEELVLIDADVTCQGYEVLTGKVDDKNAVVKNIKSVLQSNVKETLNRSYTLKINEYTVNLSNCDEVEGLLKACIEKYDTQNKYDVNLVLNPERELNVLTTDIALVNEQEAAVEQDVQAGLDAHIGELLDDVEAERELEFSDYELGLINLAYGDKVEIVESYLLDDEITPLETAIDQVTKDQETKQIYEVVSGDTLSEIAIKSNNTVEKIIEMNENLEDENSTIRIGDEIVVTVPEPELSVIRQEESYYEESYNAEIIYVDNDEWYTTQEQTLQEPSSGFHKVVAVVTYRNDTEIGRELLKEEVVMDPVPKIVEKGTKIPPTYIKPLSGGRLSSGFGSRTAPTRGASSYHKGVDWSTPVGTAIVASSAGTVAKAGWGSGYGYVVYINHADGRQTRYGHLSKVLVKAGQYVAQGEKIALSGNTGVSTGPHIHFEILVNGSQVNPIKYLD